MAHRKRVIPLTPPPKEVPNDPLSAFIQNLRESEVAPTNLDEGIGNILTEAINADAEAITAPPDQPLLPSSTSATPRKSKAMAKTFTLHSDKHKAEIDSKIQEYTAKLEEVDAKISALGAERLDLLNVLGAHRASLTYLDGGQPNQIEHE